jgi:lauroyl/myristoyl acyltransferase
MNGQVSVPHRWTFHRLNTGPVFGATYHGVRRLPRGLSYAIGHVGAWLAWKLMRGSTDALVDNLRAVMPNAPPVALARLALSTYRCYTRDAVDFIRAVSTSRDEARAMFVVEEGQRQKLEEARAGGRGLILVTAHYGNWEMGSVLIRRALDLPLTIVAMAEAEPDVERLRLSMRDDLGAETLQVRQSMDTALQIRRRLAENRIMAMLVDRHVGRDRVPVTLFGRRAHFLRTPVLLSYLTGAPLVPCFIERVAPGRFAAILCDAIEVDHIQPRDEAIRSATQQIASAVEARIRAHPEFWYQFYRYWDAQEE